MEEPCKKALCYMCKHRTGWPRLKGCLIFTGHFPQKRHIISGSFAKKPYILWKSPLEKPCLRCVSIIQGGVES